MAAMTSFALWCVVAAFVARACLPRSLDLRVYRDAARLALVGGTPYTATFTPQHFPFTYPPFALLVFTPLSALDVHSATWALDALGVVALVVALSVCARRVTQWSWASCVVLASLLGSLSCLALEPVRSTLLLGQVNLVLLAMVVLDLLVVPRRYRGVLIGLAAAVKLTPLIFIGYLVLAGDRRSALRASAAFLAASVLAWLVFPTDSRTFWLHQAFSPGHKGGARSTFNQSWWGLVGRLPAADLALRTATWLALCAVTLAVGAFVVRRCVLRTRVLDAILATAVTGLLVSPVSWTHHWCWVALVPIALLAPRPRHWALATAMWVLVATAVIAPYGWHLTGPGSVVSGFSLVGAGALLLVVMALVERRDGPVATSASRDEAVAAGPA
jgi:alpha-1,2-mannosyltransferase